MSPPALNYDILLSVLSASPPKTATSIMETCHVLYHEGAKIVLQYPLHLDGSEEKALALLRFIQAEDLSRCSYVRALNILASSVSDAVAKALGELVPRMTGLRSLGLKGAEPMFESHPYLLPVFASLRSVKTLVLLHAGNKCCELAMKLQSELISADIDFYVPGVVPSLDPFTERYPSHPVLMLQHSVSTLREFTCRSWVDMIFSRFCRVREIYPNVHKLILSDNLLPCPQPYIKAFPNLTHLIMQKGNDVFPETRTHLENMDGHMLTRGLNMQIQASKPSGGGEWEHLQTYTGPVIGLWSLGLTCPIRELLLEDEPAARPPRALTDVLAHARPTKLTIVFDDQPLIDVVKADFTSALRTDGASGLRSLMCLINLKADDRNLDVGRAFDDIGAALSGMQQLRDLEIFVRDVSLSETTTTSSDPALSALLPWVHTHASFTLGERTLADIDVQAFVHRLASSMPSLLKAFLLLPRPRPCGGGHRAAWVCRDKDSKRYTAGEVFYTVVEGMDVYL